MREEHTTSCIIRRNLVAKAQGSCSCKAGSVYLTVYASAVRGLRLANALSQEKLGQLAGVSTNTVFNIEKAKPTLSSSRKKVGEVLGMMVDKEADLVVQLAVTYCETIAAHRWHIRRLKPGEKPNYNGYRGSQPMTLCDFKSSWDIKVPVGEPSLSTSIVCCTCRERFEYPTMVKKE